MSLARQADNRAELGEREATIAAFDAAHRAVINIERFADGGDRDAAQMTLQDLRGIAKGFAGHATPPSSYCSSSILLMQA